MSGGEKEGKKRVGELETKKRCFSPKSDRGGGREKRSRKILPLRKKKKRESLLHYTHQRPAESAREGGGVRKNKEASAWGKKGGKVDFGEGFCQHLREGSTVLT